jgi:hypothetical protein
MRKSLFLILIIFYVLPTSAQNFSLSHTGTQYDSFENPVEQSFQKDLSRKYAINLLPSFFAFGNFDGEAQTSFKKDFLVPPLLVTIPTITTWLMMQVYIFLHSKFLRQLIITEN